MRKRIETNALQSWEDVDLHLKEIGENEIQIEQIEADLNLKISDLKLDAADKINKLKKRIAILEHEMQDFVENNRADIKGKTKDLTFGQTGFRKSTKIVIGNIKNAISQLKLLGLTDCIKSKESIIRDKVKDLPDEVIANIGAKKQTKDTFWYETKREKLQEAG